MMVLQFAVSVDDVDVVGLVVVLGLVCFKIMAFPTGASFFVAVPTTFEG